MCVNQTKIFFSILSGLSKDNTLGVEAKNLQVGFQENFWRKLNRSLIWEYENSPNPNSPNPN